MRFVCWKSPSLAVDLRPVFKTTTCRVPVRCFRKSDRDLACGSCFIDERIIWIRVAANPSKARSNRRSADVSLLVDRPSTFCFGLFLVMTGVRVRGIPRPNLTGTRSSHNTTKSILTLSTTKPRSTSIVARIDPSDRRNDVFGYDNYSKTLAVERKPVYPLPRSLRSSFSTRESDPQTNFPTVASNIIRRVKLHFRRTQVHRTCWGPIRFPTKRIRIFIESILISITPAHRCATLN